MRGMVIFLAVLLMFAGGAGAQDSEVFMPPMVFDWSGVQELEGTNFSYGDGLHVFQRDGDSLTYIHRTPWGEEVDKYVVKVPEEYSVYPIKTNETPVLVLYRQDQDGFWSFWAANVDGYGQLGEKVPLEIELPEHRHAGSLTFIHKIQGTVDSQGLHLMIHGSDEVQEQGHRSRANYSVWYLRYKSDFQLDYARHITWRNYFPFATSSANGPVIDKQGNVYFLTTFQAKVHLTKYTPEGELVWRNEMPDQMFTTFRNEMSSPYVMRGQPPAFVVDDEGIVHIAYNHLTRPGRISGTDIIDVVYLRVEDGEVGLSKVLSSSNAVAHFPSMTFSSGKVVVAWEEPRGIDQVLLFSVLNTDGSREFQGARINFGQQFAMLPTVYLGDDGHYTAIWAAGTRNDARLVIKSTHYPAPVSIWNKFGLVDHDQGRITLGHFFYWLAMVLFMAVVRVFTNLNVLVGILVFLFLLYKINFLEMVLSRPWQIFALLILVSTWALPALDIAETAVGQGYYLWSAISAAGIASLTLLLCRVRLNSTLELVGGYLLWLFLFMVVQVVPVVLYMVQL